VGYDLAAGRLVTLQIDRWGAQKRALTLSLVVAHATHKPLGPAGRWLFHRFAEIGGLAPASPVTARRYTEATHPEKVRRRPEQK
jgi:hypothetical protein